MLARLAAILLALLLPFLAFLAFLWLQKLRARRAGTPHRPPPVPWPWLLAAGVALVAAMLAAGALMTRGVPYGTVTDEDYHDYTPAGDGVPAESAPGTEK